MGGQKERGHPPDEHQGDGQQNEAEHDNPPVVLAQKRQCVGAVLHDFNQRRHVSPVIPDRADQYRQAAPPVIHGQKTGPAVLQHLPVHVPAQPGYPRIRGRQHAHAAALLPVRHIQRQVRGKILPKLLQKRPLDTRSDLHGPDQAPLVHDRRHPAQAEPGEAQFQTGHHLQCFLGLEDGLTIGQVVAELLRLVKTEKGSGRDQVKMKLLQPQPEFEVLKQPLVFPDQGPAVPPGQGLGGQRVRGHRGRQAGGHVQPQLQPLLQVTKIGSHHLLLLAVQKAVLAAHLPADQQGRQGRRQKQKRNQQLPLQADVP